MAKSNSSKAAKPNKARGRIQSFSFLAPTATSVQLVGEFTHWQQKPISMKKGSDGAWHVTVELPPGQHYYRFLVDGQWRDDPECKLNVPNPYGGLNSLREVT